MVSRNSPRFRSFGHPGWNRALALGLLSGLFLPAGGLAQATDPGSRLRAWEDHLRLERQSPFRELEWRAVGPMQAGARVEAIAVPPGNHGIIYVGIGSGNLWKTENNGLTWSPIFEK